MTNRAPSSPEANEFRKKFAYELIVKLRELIAALKSADEQKEKKINEELKISAARLDLGEEPVKQFKEIAKILANEGAKALQFARDHGIHTTDITEIRENFFKVFKEELINAAPDDSLWKNKALKIADWKWKSAEYVKQKPAQVLAEMQTKSYHDVFRAAFGDAFGMKPGSDEDSAFAHPTFEEMKKEFEERKAQNAAKSAEKTADQAKSDGKDNKAKKAA